MGAWLKAATRWEEDIVDVPKDNRIVGDFERVVLGNRVWNYWAQPEIVNLFLIGHMEGVISLRQKWTAGKTRY